MRAFDGTVAFVGVTTVDNRQIDEMQIDAPLPVVTPAWMTGGQNPIGVVRQVEQRGNNVWASGEVDLEPGEYPVGVDLFRVYLTREPDADGLMRFGGTCRQVVVYRPGVDAQQAAWPDAKIVVTE